MDTMPDKQQPTPDPFEQITWPYVTTENGQPRIINNAAEYREHLQMLQHRIDFQIADLRAGTDLAQEG